METGVDNLLKKTAVAAALCALAYVVLFFFVDRAVVLWIHNNCQDTWLPVVGKYLSYSAQGPLIRVGLALCFILILITDSGLKRRETRVLLYICICGAIAITIGDALKYLLGRYRPIMLFDHDLYGLRLFSKKWVMNSTPSGHTIRAFSILTAVSLVFRRFAVVFISIAAIIGLSRVAVTDHYPSDVLFGAYIGIFTALWTYVHFFRDEKRRNEHW
jgi:membrane-associated phospholipid phosphatase